ncbi:NAD(P)-binding protein [Thozetella sp. PMI_491]|nr:NAD(P)-binding protein [Thozetella sp. PMI_491]
MTESGAPLGPVIVTGGCGFIGFHIVTRLVESETDCEVHVIDINIDRNRVSGATYHTCDISSLPDVEAVFALAKPKTIFHIACPDSTVHQDAVFYRVNVVGARNLLAAARKIRTVQAFVNTTTSSIIHDNVSDLRDADETLPVLQYPAQKRVYTLTKAEAEAEILAATRESGDASMLTVSIRPASAFGPRDSVTMGKMVANARAGKANIQMGDGNNYYDFVYISNLVDAHMLAAQALVRAYGKPPPAKDVRVDGQAFHVTNGEPVKFWEFHRAIAASVGQPVRKEDIRVVPVWVALLFAAISEWVTWVRTFGKGHAAVTREMVRLTVITRTLNGDKARRVLGYRPRVSIEEGLAIAGKWYMEEERKAQDKKTI